MPISPHVLALRKAVGPGLLLLPAAAAIVRDSEGAILLHRRADDGNWSLPAGAIEPGETPARAAVREVREETGLEVAAERLLGLFGGAGFRHVYPNGDRVEYLVAVFGCRILGGPLDMRDGEATELRHFAPDAMPELGLAYPPEMFREADAAPFWN
jgi:mutator protein MutT